MFKKILALLTVFAVGISTSSLAPIVSAQNTSGGAVQLEIEAPATATVGEAIDVTVKALDKDKNVATDYRGSIVFISEWISDTLPMPGRSIAFTAEDQGVKKFSKGVIFKKVGKNKLSVQDLDSNITGEVEIMVQEADGNLNNNSEEITITTPQNNGKIVSDSLTITGKTRKNSKVKLELNGSDLGVVISDDTGLFTKDIQDITQESNLLKAYIIDADDKIIGTSPEVTFIKTNEQNSIYGVTIDPSTTVEASSEITINVEAVAGLQEVSILLDGTTLPAKEGTAGKYSVKTRAPLKVGEYPITVNAKTVTGQTTTKENIITLTTTEKKEEPKKEETKEEPKQEEPRPAFKNVKAESKNGRVTFTFSVENPPKDLDTFRITYDDKSITTYQATKILKNDVYTWYIDNLPPKEYTFTIHGQKSDKNLIENLSSEPMTVTIGVNSCTISNVGKVNIQTNTSTSVLTWDEVPGANGYNVYRVEKDGKYSLVKHTNNPTYTLFLSRGAITYDNFAIKATCGEGDGKGESKDYSLASRVQTGPGAIAFLVILSGLFAVLILRRRTL